MGEKKINKIALVGNPNCGKTTIFNALTGSNQKIGNWPGVTVEKKEGFFNWENKKIEVVDLPGIYSLATHSEDEKVARNFIFDEKPDLIVNIIDSVSLERNLYLTCQLLEMGVPLLIVLNRKDLAEKHNISIDLNHLSEHLSFPVINISALKNNDLFSLKNFIAKQVILQPDSSFMVSYVNEVEDFISKWSDKLNKFTLNFSINSRWLALKLIERNFELSERIDSWASFIQENQEEIDKDIGRIENLLKESIEVIMANGRYSFISGLLRDVLTKKYNKRKISDLIDNFVLNRFLGVPIFFGIMYFLFWFTITVGGALIDFFDQFFGVLLVEGFSELLILLKSPPWLISILAKGVGAGVQTVSTFIPIVFCMFFILSILEDSGYMARAAFIMDKFLSKIGLPGKSFVPMILGFGCSVPAIMATRTLESKRDKILTIFLIPLMSCGAKLPVYALFGAAFFSGSSGMMVFSLYLMGILVAIFSGLVLKTTIFKGEQSHLVMELPLYNAPRLKHILFHTWMRVKQFIFKAGKIIVLAVLVLSFFNSLGKDGSFNNENSSNSVLATVSKVITPAFTPLGIEQDNWPATVGILSGLFAKEAVVGTLNSLYSQMETENISKDEKNNDFNLGKGVKEALKTIPNNFAEIFSNFFNFGFGESEKNKIDLAEETGVSHKIYSYLGLYFSKGKWQAYAYLLFILLYFPCLAAFGVIVKEIGFKLGMFLAFYLTLVAWSIATIFYQILVGHQLGWIALAVFFLGSLFLFLKFMPELDK